MALEVRTVLEKSLVTATRLTVRKRSTSKSATYLLRARIM